MINKNAKNHSELKTTVQIGKNGITDSLLKEILKQLKKNKMVKIKLLRSFLDDKSKKEAVSILVQKTGATLVKAVGFVVVLKK